MSHSFSVKRILVPVDGSDLSLKAARYAIHLAKVENAELIALNVIEDIKQGGAIGLQAKYGNVSLVDAFRRARKESAQEWLNQIGQEAEIEGVKLKAEIINDKDKTSVTGVIIEYAESKRADLIIIGSKGRSRLERLLVGGVTNSLVNSSRTSLLIIR
jgi:nucleotide-binding universal stress UspA family protein